MFISFLVLLKRSLLPNAYTASLRGLVPQCFSPSIILTSFQKVWWFPFSSIYEQRYPTFWFQHILLLFNVHVALLFMTGISRICMLYHGYIGWNIYNSWTCCLLLGALFEIDILQESSHVWILPWYYMGYQSFAYKRSEIQHWSDKLFSGIILRRSFQISWS